MKRSFSILLTLVCLAALWGVFAQRWQLADLRAEHEQLSARVAAETAQPSRSIPATGVSSNLLDLLSLRNEVTQLGQRKQSLANVTNENQRLRAELENARTNRTSASAGLLLPPGYVRKSQAQFKGYATPEDTLQSALWAAQNHDFKALLQAFSPQMAQEIQKEMEQTELEKPGQSQEQIWRDTDRLIGFRVASREPLPDGSVILQVEDAPGASPTPVHLRSVDGQWKLDEPK